MKNLNMIYLKKVLEDYTDEKHHLTQEEIADYIWSECGVRPERKTIGRNIARLRDDFGMDIRSDRKGAWLATREFDDVEIKLLIDSVLGNKYIPEEDATQIIEKLEDLTSVYFSTQSKDIYVMDEKKRTNISGLFNNIEIVAEAIKDKKAIYYEDINGNQVLNDKAIKSCVCSMTMFPICIIFMEHRYYVVARYMEDVGIKGLREQLAYIPLHNIENIKIIESKGDCKPLSDEEKKNLKLMVKGEHLQDGVKKIIKFIGPKTFSLIIQSYFAESEVLMSDIHDGNNDERAFLPKMPKCIYEVNTSNNDFMEFYRKHMTVIKVISPKSIVNKIETDLKRALMHNEN